jgi:hypothetical protein
VAEHLPGARSAVCLYENYMPRQPIGNTMPCMTKPKEDGRKPAWATPCLRFIDYASDVDGLVTLTGDGISHLRRVPIILELAITGLGSTDEAKSDERVKLAKETAQLAESEIAKDFPLLHSHAVMGVWGALEAMVEDLAISWIEHNPSILSEPKIARIRIPLVEFQMMEQQDRLRFLVSELQRDLGAELKSGATRFESLLSALGLGGPLDKRIRDILFEAQNLRNIFAHRGGVADRRFIANCPQLHYVVGDTVTIDTPYFDRILRGLVMYSTIILNRCRVIDGLRPITTEFSGFEGVLSASGKEE